MPLLVNLLFGLLGLGFLMCLHAGSAQELLSADGTRREKKKSKGESVKFVCNTGFFRATLYLFSALMKDIVPCELPPP